MKITEKNLWTANSVAKICRENNLYTLGNNEEYSKMLDFVRNNEADSSKIFIVAKDILENSEHKNLYSDDNEYLLNIMFILKNDACTTVYEEVK